MAFSAAVLGRTDLLLEVPCLLPIDAKFLWEQEEEGEMEREPES